MSISIRALGIVLVVILIFFASLIALLTASSEQPFGIRTDKRTAPEVTVIVDAQSLVAQQSYHYEVNYIGRVEAVLRSNIGFEVSGTLQQVFKDAGDTVAAGDLLARLDTERLQAQRQEAEALVVTAQENINLAKRTLSRIEPAERLNAVSPQQGDEARSDLAIAQAALTAAEASLVRIEVDLKKSELRAPFSGVILERNTDTGTIVQPGLSVFDMQQLDTLDIRVGIPATAVTQLEQKESVAVKISNDQFINAQWIALLPTRGAQRTQDLLLRLPTEGHRLIPGDTIHVPLNYHVEQPGYWIPVSALKEGRRGLWSLFIVTQGALNSGNEMSQIAERRSIEVLYTNGNKAYVRGAISDGEQVVVSGVHKLVPGQALRIATSVAATAEVSP